MEEKSEALIIDKVDTPKHEVTDVITKAKINAFHDQWDRISSAASEKSATKNPDVHSVSLQVLAAVK